MDINGVMNETQGGALCPPLSPLPSALFPHPSPLIPHSRPSLLTRCLLLTWHTNAKLKIPTAWKTFQPSNGNTGTFHAVGGSERREPKIITATMITTPTLSEAYFSRPLVGGPVRGGGSSYGYCMGVVYGYLLLGSD